MSDDKTKIFRLRDILFILSVALVSSAFVAAVYTSLTLSSDIGELEELNESMRNQLIEKNVEIEWLKNRITVLEGEAE